MLLEDSEEKIFKNKFLLTLSDKQFEENYNNRKFSLLKYKNFMLMLCSIGILNLYFLYYLKNNQRYSINDIRNNSTQLFNDSIYSRNETTDVYFSNNSITNRDNDLVIEIEQKQIFLSIINFSLNLLVLCIVYFPKLFTILSVHPKKILFLKILTIYSIFSFFTQLESLKLYLEIMLDEIFKKNNYNYIIFLIKLVFNYFRVVYFDNSFFNNLISTAIGFVIFPCLNFWNQTKYLEIMVNFAFYAFWCFIIYKLEKFEKICFVLKENAIKINVSTKKLLDDLSSGIVKIKENKIIEINSKINEYLNSNSQIESGFDSKSNLNDLQIKNFIFTGFSEFNNQLDDTLKENLEEINMISKNSKTCGSEKDFENLINVFQKNSEIFCNEIILIGKKTFMKKTIIHNNYINEEELVLRVFVKYCKIEKTFVVIVSDITSIVKTEELNAQNKYKKLFLNKFSHEFKNPILNINQLIKDFRNFLKDSANDFQNLPFQQKETWAEIIKKSIGLKHVNNICNYMTTLINDFDILANIELTENYSQNNLICANDNNNNNVIIYNQNNSNPSNVNNSKNYNNNNNNNVNLSRTDININNYNNNTSINLLEMKNNVSTNNLINKININTNSDFKNKASNSSYKEINKILSISLNKDMIVSSNTNNIDKKQINIHKDQVNLRKILKFCFEIFQTKIELNEKNIEINYFIDESIPEYVISDERRLKQILINLLSNSFKFTNTGFINIKVLKPENGDSSYVNFIVEDSGNGIKTEILQNICQPFKKLDVESNIFGAGLGLYIVKRLIDKLGSNLEICSEVQKGTKISFSLDIFNVENKGISKNLNESENQDKANPDKSRSSINNKKNSVKISNTYMLSKSNDNSDISNARKTNINQISNFNNSNLNNSNHYSNSSLKKNYGSIINTSYPIKKWAYPVKEKIITNLNESNKTINNGNTIINIQDIPTSNQNRISNCKKYNDEDNLHNNNNNNVKNKKRFIGHSVLISNGMLANKSYTMNILKKYTRIYDSFSKTERKKINGNKTIFSKVNKVKEIKSSTDLIDLNKNSTGNHSHSKFLEPRFTNSSISINNTFINSPYSNNNSTVNNLQVNNNLDQHNLINRNNKENSNLSANSNIFGNSISVTNRPFNINNIINNNSVLNNQNNNVNYVNNKKDNTFTNTLISNLNNINIENINNESIHLQRTTSNFSSSNIFTPLTKENSFYYFYNHNKPNLGQESNISEKTVVIESPTFKFKYLKPSGYYNAGLQNLKFRLDSESNNSYLIESSGNLNKSERNDSKSEFTIKHTYEISNNKLSPRAQNSLSMNCLKEKDENSKFKINEQNTFEYIDSKNSSIDKDLDKSKINENKNLSISNKLVFLNTFGEASHSKTNTLSNNNYVNICESVSKKNLNKHLSPFNFYGNNNNQLSLNFNNINSSKNELESNLNNELSNNYLQNNLDFNSNNNEKYHSTSMLLDESGNNLINIACSNMNKNHVDNSTQNIKNNNFNLESENKNEKIIFINKLNNSVLSNDASLVNNNIKPTQDIIDPDNYIKFKNVKDNQIELNTNKFLNRNVSNKITDKIINNANTLTYSKITNTNCDVCFNLANNLHNNFDFEGKSELEKTCNFTITDKPEFPVKEQLTYENNNYNLLNDAGVNRSNYSFAIDTNKFVNVLSTKQNKESIIENINQSIPNNSSAAKIKQTNLLTKEITECENYQMLKTSEKDDLIIKESANKSCTDCDLLVNNCNLNLENYYEREFVEEEEEQVNEKKIFRVFVVDDEKLIRESEVCVLKKFFKKNKEKFSELEVVECIDGLECLFQIWLHLQQGIKFDAIITDQSMNFMRGSLLAQNIKNLISENVMYDIKIFMVTSYEPHLITNTVGNLLDDIYTKPLSMDNVRSICNKF